LPGRRTLLRGAAAAVAGIAVGWLAPPRTARAQQIANDIDNVGPRIRVISGLGGNVLVHAADNAHIVVDSGAAEHAQTVAATVQSLTARDPLTALFNTHWHRDQVGGNAHLTSLGGEIIAHEKTLLHLSTPYYLPDEDRYEAPLPAAAHPTRAFYSEGVLDAGQRRISYGYLLEAHTDGDIFVHFENDNVIAAGGAISPLRDPEFDWFGGGWIGGRIDSLERLLERSDSGTRFVPSFGPVVDRAYVESELELMLGLYDILFERVRAGESAEDIHASGALDALPRQFDDPARLLYDVHKSIWAHYNTISPDIV
jgi:glyoxylase-like metal-dependent hydrolase (beta-lactamase superfamily II)